MRLGIFIGLALAVAIALATLASPFASSSPDGLNRVAMDQGFDEAGTLHPVQEDAPVPGYAFPGVGGDRGATAAAGLAGTVTVFLLAFGAAAVLRRRTPRAAPA